MRRARFKDPAGYVRTGEWTDDGIVEAGRTHDPDEVDVLPPVEPSKVLGIGRNYRHADEDPDRPDRPRLWLKGGPNVVSGHGDTVTLPDADEVIYEAELGVVIGEQCRHVPPDRAMDAVAGFTCADDISNQDAVDDVTFIRRKSFDNAAPLGPVLASPDRVPDEPRVRLWLNGEKRQDSRDERFLYPIPEVISAFSEWVTLEPEDVIIMGTPSGIDELRDGDHVAIEVEGVGRLEHDVAEP